MPLFAMLDGNPVRYTKTEAWWHTATGWVQLNIMEVGNNATVISEEEFNTYFPDLEALPDDAFKSPSRL